MILVYMPTLLVVALLFTGCSTVSQKRLPDFSTTEARLDAAMLVANPEAKVQIQKAREQLESAKSLCVSNTLQLEEAVRDKNEAQTQSEYWKAKQRKALKELWIYRGALIALGLFIFRNWIFGGVACIARKFVGIPW